MRYFGITEKEGKIHTRDSGHFLKMFVSAVGARDGKSDCYPFILSVLWIVQEIVNCFFGAKSRSTTELVWAFRASSADGPIWITVHCLSIVSPMSANHIKWAFRFTIVQGKHLLSDWQKVAENVFPKIFRPTVVYVLTLLEGKDYNHRGRLSQLTRRE